MEYLRPLKFPSPSDLENRIEEYFFLMDEQNRPYTLSGLAVYLDTTRQTLLNYEEKLEFHEIISRAKERILNYKEELLLSKEAPTSGVIFDLKNNHGFVDRQEVKQDISGSVDLLSLFSQAQKETDQAS